MKPAYTADKRRRGANLAADEHWIDKAACANLTPAESDRIFFTGEKTPTARPSAEAQALCGSCPIRDKCLEAELRAEEEDPLSMRFGIYGGLTPRERTRLAAPARPSGKKALVCGTTAMYSAHRRRKEKPCEECMEARRQYERQYKRNRKGAA